jgi:hypothetical protein
VDGEAVLFYMPRYISRLLYPDGFRALPEGGLPRSPIALLPRCDAINRPLPLIIAAWRCALRSVISNVLAHSNVQTGI